MKIELKLECQDEKQAITICQALAFKAKMGHLRSALMERERRRLMDSRKDDMLGMAVPDISNKQITNDMIEFERWLNPFFTYEDH